MPDLRIEIRAFAPSDLESVVGLTRELQRFELQFAADHAPPDQEFGEWYVGRLLGVLREQDGVLLVAAQDGAVCGFSAGYVEDDPEARSRYFYIAELSVTERMRGHGIGSQLIGAMEDAARDTQPRDGRHRRAGGERARARDSIIGSAIAITRQAEKETVAHGMSEPPASWNCSVDQNHASPPTA